MVKLLVMELPRRSKSSAGLGIGSQRNAHDSIRAAVATFGGIRPGWIFRKPQRHLDLVFLLFGQFGGSVYTCQEEREASNEYVPEIRSLGEMNMALMLSQRNKGDCSISLRFAS